MSVLIKGAKPPSGCRWCYFNEDTKCALIVWCDIDNTNGMQRRENCPLIELPEHGDLIDRDVLLSKVEKWYWEALETVKNMPVVIPAERREE